MASMTADDKMGDGVHMSFDIDLDYGKRVLKHFLLGTFGVLLILEMCQ